jgi:polyhydroxybutyrate depolymerase
MMRNYLFILLFFLSSLSFAQQTINDSIFHNGIYRTYILYIPAAYNATNATPLVINFHGYTSNANAQMYYGDFRAIADTANFILVHPMGTLDGNNQPYWNADWGGTVDDIGFTAALIDSLSAQYNINQNRVYSTGMSNGGFMSYTLACSLSSRVAAIASVTGSMNANQSLNCSPQHPTPVMEIHGTADATVPYNGSTGIASITNVLNYWVNFNQCNATAVFSNMPNINTSDGCTAEHYVYQSGNNGIEIEHYKIIDGGHTWPGAPVNIGVTNHDFNASEKIWQFFAQYDLNGKINPTYINQIGSNTTVEIFPNPTENFLTIKTMKNLTKATLVYDLTGKLVKTIEINQFSFSLNELDKGIYFIQLNIEEEIITKKFIKN